MVDQDRDRPHSLSIWATDRPVSDYMACRTAATTWNAFIVGPASGSVRGRIIVRGRYLGEIVEPTVAVEAEALARLRVELVQVDVAGAEACVTDQSALDVDHQAGMVTFDSDFGVVLEAMLLPGETYRVRLSAAVDAYGLVRSYDFGSPGSGRGFWYDSVKVCIDAPDVATLDTRLGSLELNDIEESLYRSECVPSLWLPATHGGRLERARQLVSDLRDEAIASHAPGVDGPGAAARLLASDAAAASGDYQRACCNLSQALRALTAPRPAKPPSSDPCAPPGSTKH
jgi:hypothetical protein